MQTNREYLLENPEVMVNAMVLLGGAGKALGVCKWRDKQKKPCLCITCTTCFSEWLEAEHEESDTIEQIKKDALKSPSDYWRCRGTQCYKCPHTPTPLTIYKTGECYMAMRLDIIARCEKVLGK